MIKIIFLLLFFPFLLLSSDFDTFLHQQQKEFTQYKNSYEKEFQAYKKAYDKSLIAYKKEIQAHWPSSDISSAHQFIQYDKAYFSKKTIDFKNESIEFECIADNENDAREKLLQAWKELMQENVKSAYEKDQLESKINQELNRTLVMDSQEKLISDVISPLEQDAFIHTLKQQPLEKKIYEKKTIYRLNIKLPSDTMVKKAQRYKESIQEYALKNKIPKELIYAIIHSESSFNPMARSHIPAFGLMQIVPKSAGIDSYYFLYGQKKVLSAQYLYQPLNNIKMGSTYLHILYFNYLRDIKDPLSRLYCSIAAYNTGAGNVAKSFIGTSNIRKASHTINSMKSEEVYKHLLRYLPYSETKQYLLHVNERRFSYMKLIQNKTL